MSLVYNQCLHPKSHLPCDICFWAKQTHTSFSTSSNKASKTFSLIHYDVWGPYNVDYNSGGRYFLTILLWLLASNFCVFNAWKEWSLDFLTCFYQNIKNQFHVLMKQACYYSVWEFICLKDFFLDHGLIHQTTIPCTSEQNGLFERKHYHIINVARALQFQANLPISLLRECVLTAVFLNKSYPFFIVAQKTPFELLYGTPLIFTHSEHLVVYVTYMIRPLSMKNLIQEVASVFLILSLVIVSIPKILSSMNQFFHMQPGMTWDMHENIESFQGFVTRSRARKLDLKMKGNQLWRVWSYKQQTYHLSYCRW